MINLKIELKIYYTFLKSFVRVDFDSARMIYGLRYIERLCFKLCICSLNIHGNENFRKAKIIF